MKKKGYLFQGYATKMKLQSVYLSGERFRRLEQDTEQHLTISRDGRIWFSGYGPGESGKTEKLRQFQEKIDPEDANYFLASVGYEMSKVTTEFNPQLRNGRIWEMELTNEKDEVYKFEGNLLPENKMLTVMSDWFRKRLGSQRYYVFDGEARFPIVKQPGQKVYALLSSIMFPEYEPDWYFFDGDDICIGDQFLAPTWRGDKSYNAEVVDIMVAKPENGPVSVKKQEKMPHLGKRYEFPPEMMNMMKRMGSSIF